jgi:hypothetical protein
MIVVITLKLNLRVDPGQVSGHWSRPESLVEAWGTGRIDICQYKNKNSYYHILKLNLEVDLGNS